jgi:hypothetical protein
MSVDYTHIQYIALSIVPNQVQYLRHAYLGDQKNQAGKEIHILKQSACRTQMQTLINGLCNFLHYAHYSSLECIYLTGLGKPRRCCVCITLSTWVNDVQGISRPEDEFLPSATNLPCLYGARLPLRFTGMLD